MNGYTRKKSLRLQNYDYAQNGLYFITICTQNSKQLFGRIENGNMLLNSAGDMVKTVWSEIPLYYDGFILHEFVVMPNHIHGVIEIVNHDEQRTATGQRRTATGGLSLQNRMTVSDVVHRFKTLTTRRYITGVYDKGWESFHKKVWQRSYHEHIIRSDVSYRKIVEYVQLNPMKWKEDCYFM